MNKISYFIYWKEFIYIVNKYAQCQCKNNTKYKKKYIHVITPFMYYSYYKYNLK